MIVCDGGKTCQFAFPKTQPLTSLITSSTAAEAMLVSHSRPQSLMSNLLFFYKISLVGVFVLLENRRKEEKCQTLASPPLRCNLIVTALAQISRWTLSFPRRRLRTRCFSSDRPHAAKMMNNRLWNSVKLSSRSNLNKCTI